MPDPLLTPAQFREAQAGACLQAAAAHKGQLLAVAVRLAGTPEGGMDLFQQVCLNAHDAIQVKGFVGTEYRFYLLTAIKHLHRRNRQLQALRFGLDGFELAPAPAPATDARGHLADQMMQEVKDKFSPADRLLLRLHLDGHSYPAISELTQGLEQSRIWRRVTRMKNHLRQAFAQAWANLDAE